MITLIGDVHGETKRYQKLVRRMPPGQRSIQLGDMGIGFPYAGLHKMPDEHKWFRGNHDNPEKCRRTTNYLGDYGFLPYDSLFWVAGAFSIDRMWRTQGIDYWVDEELSYEELGKVIELYARAKPRFVISHEAPADVGRILLSQQLQDPYILAKHDCCNSRTSQALQNMFDIHKPVEWVFGHYHVDWHYNLRGTKFTCVPIMGTYELNTDADEQRPSVVL